MKPPQFFAAMGYSQLKDPLLTMSAVRLAELIKTGEHSSREVVEVHIEHALRVNPTLNAIVHDRFAQARKDSDRADELMARMPPEELPAFHGVPCTIKESFKLTGMPNTSGLVSRKGILATEDAPTVARLRAAGAIPLGVTNVSELCMWMESNNHVYGRSNNPYDPNRIVGGSSGGEGAIVGSGASPFGLGADVGGSIRMPAFFNGVFGHKPTGGLVPNTGQYPITGPEGLRMLTTGPICRRAEDLMPLLRVLAGPSDCDSKCLPLEIGDPGSVSFAGRTVVSIESDGRMDVSEELLEAQRACARHLESMGANVRTESLATLRHGVDIWGSQLGDTGGESFKSLLTDGGNFRAFRELVRWSMRRSEHTLPAIVLALIEFVPELTPRRTQRFLDMSHQLDAEIQDLLGPDGILLYPSHPCVAPRHYEPLLYPFRAIYTAILNVLELPVTQVPMGLNESGLPLGVQVGTITSRSRPP